MSGALLSLGVALVAITAAQAAPVPVDEILSYPDRFDAQMVSIEGTMTDLKRRVTSPRRSLLQVPLERRQAGHPCDLLGSPPCQSGVVMVEGTFAKITRGPGYTSFNVVSASRVICRQGRSRDEPGASRVHERGGAEGIRDVGGGKDPGRFLRAGRSSSFSALIESPSAASSRGANVPSTATTMLPARMVWTPESYTGVVEIDRASPTWPPLVSST